MPGEFEPHRGTVLIWPVRPGSWPYDGKEAKRKFAEIAGILSRHERVWMLADAAHVAEAEAMLAETCSVNLKQAVESCGGNAEICGKPSEGPATVPCGVASEQSVESCGGNAKAGGKASKESAGNCGYQVLEIPTDDAWARDVGPTCIVDDRGGVLGIDWQFNAWGGTFDGLYSDWRLDNAAAAKICAELGMDAVDAQDFVLEGGSIASDGEGTVVVTACCLLSKGRNPHMTKEQIEARLKDMLGAEKVIWLPNGIYNDETNGHVDNIFAFTAPGEAVLAWTDDENDPQYALSLEDLQVLEQERDARGRKIKVHKLYIPSKPICIQASDLKGYRFEPGEDEREEGERLAASYVNFYIGNETILVPQFGDANDSKAVELLRELFPDRKVWPIQARCILVGGGNIHCITQQIPLG